MTSLLWTEVAPNYLRPAGWIFAIGWWLGAAVVSLRKLPQIATANPAELNQGLFAAAQTEYLKGNWIEAEASVRNILRQTPRDVESLLLLATIHRRTKRHDEARGELQQIARLDAADCWQVELRKEREMLRRATQQEKIEQLEGFTSPFDVESENEQPTSPPTSTDNTCDSSQTDQSKADQHSTPEPTEVNPDEQQSRHAA